MYITTMMYCLYWPSWAWNVWDEMNEMKQCHNKARCPPSLLEVLHNGWMIFIYCYPFIIVFTMFILIATGLLCISILPVVSYCTSLFVNIYANRKKNAWDSLLDSLGSLKIIFQAFTYTVFWAACLKSLRLQQFQLLPQPSVNQAWYLLQVLNEFFHNVCELDLVFNFYKVSLWPFSIQINKLQLILTICNTISSSQRWNFLNLLLIPKLCKSSFLAKYIGEV